MKQIFFKLIVMLSVGCITPIMAAEALEPSRDVDEVTYSKMCESIAAAGAPLERLSRGGRIELYNLLNGPRQNNIRLEIFKLMLRDDMSVNCPDKNGVTFLLNAAEAGDASSCEFLIRNQADVNQRSHMGVSPLHEAAGKGMFKICKQLIEKKAIVNAQDMSGNTPLLRAASLPKSDVCKLLIDHGAMVSLPNDKGVTPLHVAIQHKRLDTCKLLVKEGASVDAKNDQGKSPVDLVPVGLFGETGEDREKFRLFLLMPSIFPLELSQGR